MHDSIFSIIEPVLPISLTILCGVVWFIRLEAKVLYLEKEHNTTKELHKEKYELIWNKISLIEAHILTIMQSLSKIEGRLEARSRARVENKKFHE